MEKDRTNLVNFFRASGYFSHDRSEEIASHFIEKEISKNEFQLKEGKVCDEYLFLEEGFMRAFAYDINGIDVTTNFYSKNQLVFEVSSYFNRTVSRENIQALTNCRGWHIDYEQLNTLFHTIPEFREFGRSILVKGFTALKVRMLSMITETAEERYARLLKTNQEVFQNAPLKKIASYLGVTDSSLSRIRKEFSNK